MYDKFKIGIEDLTWTFSTKKTIIFWHFLLPLFSCFSCSFFTHVKTLQLIFNIFTQTNLLSI